MNLILARHGLTDWNTAQRFQGQSDVPLNDLGRRQAAALAKKMMGEPLKAVISSDLQRARLTAQTIAEQHAVPWVNEPRLREVSFGKWEGLTYAEIQADDPQSLAVWEKDTLSFAPPGGESLAQLAERLCPLLKRLTEQYAGQTVLIIAHGGPLQALICLALGLPVERYWQFHLAPASISRLAFYPAGVIINSLNETGHLEGL
jgi:2,3-bisphosphoglycerate-dependent phosphoglycerate mutase